MHWFIGILIAVLGTLFCVALDAFLMRVGSSGSTARDAASGEALPGEATAGERTDDEDESA